MRCMHCLAGLGIFFALSNSVMADVVEAFTYHGFLQQDGQPYTGTADLRFTLYDAPTGGNQVSGSYGLYNRTVDQGRFAVPVGFTADEFPLDTTWLEVEVRTPGFDGSGHPPTTGFTTLTPRQRITPVPYAYHTRGVFTDSDGRVGIRTTSPVAPLHVNGHIALGQAQADMRIREVSPFDAQGWAGLINLFGIGIGSNTGGNRQIMMLTDGFVGQPIFTVADSTDGGATWHSNLVVTQGGDVGVGKAIPDTRLHVHATRVGPNDILSQPENNVALIENSSIVERADVLALQIRRPPSEIHGDKFVTMFDGNDSEVGAIIGNGQGGVNFRSFGGDYAEYLPLAADTDNVEPGDVIGIHAGRVSHRTAGAQQVAVISTAPIVVGNMPPRENGREVQNYAIVAFLGQAPVKVRGPVRAGDFVVASGQHDGTAVAVSPQRITLEQLDQVVGTAWEASSEKELHQVNVAVGVDQAAAVQRIVDRLTRSARAMEQQLERQQAQIDAVTERLDALESRNNLTQTGRAAN